MVLQTICSVWEQPVIQAGHRSAAVRAVHGLHAPFLVVV